MRYPRFRVATVTGYPIGERVVRASGAKGPTTAATVCDTLHLWKEVKTYRAEDRQVLERKSDGTVLGATTIGNEEAIRRAEDHAAYLNKLWRLEQRRDRMRGYRG